MAATLVELWLRKERDDVLTIIRSHPYYQDQNTQERLKIEQECVKFFDRRYTYQVGKLVGVELRKFPQANWNKVMQLGGTADTLARQGLDVGSYNEKERGKNNKEMWEYLLLPDQGS